MRGDSRHLLQAILVTQRLQKCRKRWQVRLFRQGWAHRGVPALRGGGQALSCRAAYLRRLRAALGHAPLLVQCAGPPVQAQVRRELCARVRKLLDNYSKGQMLLQQHRDDDAGEALKTGDDMSALEATSGGQTSSAPNPNPYPNPVQSKAVDSDVFMAVASASVATAVAHAAHAAHTTPVRGKDVAAPITPPPPPRHRRRRLRHSSIRAHPWSCSAAAPRGGSAPNGRDHCAAPGRHGAWAQQRGGPKAG
jgi:hypothetical protein